MCIYKTFAFINLLFSIIFIAPSAGFSQPISTANLERSKIDDKIIADFTSNGITESEAVRILDSIIGTFIATQRNISDIASKITPRSQRVSLKTSTLRYFESPRSTIEVSSKYRETLTYEIRVYLDRLMNLEYHEVSLYYGKHFDISRLAKNSASEYELGIAAWQNFVARNADGQIIYKDKTLKIAFFTVKKTSMGWQTKINHIRAEETLDFIIGTDY